MFLQGMLASIVIGSDLYMILTGYLCYNKGIDKKFYISDIKVLLSYVFFSILTICVNIYLFHTGMTWKSGLMGIFSFSTIPYAWYIEMWIGLFLLAPFLNIWYKALPSRRIKLNLILLLVLLTALPDFFNRYGLYIIPQFWENIYPVAFYFIGCFLREYRPIFSRRLLLTLILIVLLISPGITIISGHPTFLHIIGDRNGLFIGAMAVSIFMLFYQTDIQSRSFRNIFKAISLWSLDIFLCSAILDFYIYPLFKEMFYINQSQYCILYFIIVPLIFCICFIIASIKREIFNILAVPLKYLKINIPLQNVG